MGTRLVAAALLVAELAHLAAAWQQWVLLPLLAGIHLAVAGVLGLLLAGLVTGGPGRRALHWGIGVMAASALVWLATHTLGVPSLLTLRPAEVTAAGVAATVADVALIVVLGLRLRATVPSVGRRAPSPDGSRARVVLGTSLAVLGVGLLTNVFFVPLDVLLDDPSIAPSPVREVAIALVLIGAVLLMAPRRAQPVQVERKEES